MDGLKLHTSNGKDKRRELDFYPTPPEVTIALMDFLKLDPDIQIWEPACGQGEMSKVLQTYVKYVQSSDIGDYGYGKPFLNYLLQPLGTYDAIITNPPFKEADEFIRKAVKEADLVCMLLKSQYWHSRSRYALFQEHTPAYVLPLTWRPDFLPKGTGSGRPTMEVAWSVWMPWRTDYHPCQYIPVPKPKK